MSIPVIRHVSFEGPGYLGQALRAAGLPFACFDLFDHVAPPDANAIDSLIVMGGPMSANDPLDYLRVEMGLIEQALRRGIPVLGICLGAQLIAKVLGARVFRNRVSEIGWFPVHWTAAGIGDLLFHGLPQPADTFHWHGEMFDLPAGAELLAWSERCAHQAFRFGKNVYGLQFHPEVDPDMVQDWITQDENCSDVRELE